MTSTIRIDKLLASMGYGSRREVEALIDRDLVHLDGEVLVDCTMRVELNGSLRARLQVDGEPLDPLPNMVVMLHKPVGVTCSHKESGALIYDLLPSRWKRREPKISSIGRLDKDTSGLLLMTDDGQLLHKVISPKHHVAKVYVATLARPLEGDEGTKFASGTLMLEGEEKPLLPAEMEIIDATTARLTLHEGRYHQVRRMFAAVGNHVAALHRESIGELRLPIDLTAGDHRVLTPEDIARIFVK